MLAQLQLQTQLNAQVRAPHSMDCTPARWPESPRIVVQCDLWASNGPNHLLNAQAQAAAGGGWAAGGYDPSAAMGMFGMMGGGGPIGGGQAAAAGQCVIHSPCANPGLNSQQWH